MKNPVAEALFRTWFTGALYCLAAVGYVFYGLLWTFRFMQKFKVLFLAVVAPVVLAIAAAAYLLIPFRATTIPVEIVIGKGTTIHAVARKLKQERVVPSSHAFVLWLEMLGIDKKMQAGRVSLYRGEGIMSASRKLLHAEPIEITMTVPEGLTLEQTAAIVGATFGIDSAAFLSACADQETLRRLGIPAQSPEGYLFPDTYRFPPDVKASDIVMRMVNHGIEMYATLVPDSSVQGFSKQEIVTLASIVEKEATLASERPLVSGVFHNRLTRKMALGADPTIRYALRKFSGPLLESDLATETPYNTRRHTGLPPGPICSPGLASLRAALFPEKTKELYFVAKWDGSGAHDFSITNKEHERKKNEIRRMNEIRKSQAAREKK
jgi:UPF0755 protein